MNRYALVLLGVWSIGLRYASCGNILLASEVLSPSHQIWNYALAEGLMAKGHNVTMLGPFADRGNSSDKYHPLLLEGYLDLLLQNEDLDLKSFSDLQPIPFMRALINYSLKVCNHSYHTRGFKTLLSYPRDFRFDLIIVEVTQNACLYPLIQRFGYPPSIAATAFLLPPYAAANFGNQLYTSYLPAYFSDYGGDMGFLQRLANHVFTYADATVRWDYEMQTIEKMARRVFGEDMDSMARLMRHMTLLLCNLDPVVTHPQPLPPNIVPVGGLHVKRAKKLPGNLLAIMENSKNGVILFSLGTNIQSANLGRKTLRALLDAFSKLKLTVLWKFETELNVTLPKNVIVRKWLPQNDILGHRNTKLFISHCGALGTYEAVYHGVPMVGMPFFADQKIIANNLVDRKLARKLHFQSLTSQELLETINEVLTNPVYSNNMREISRRFRDQPQSPLDRAVFYAEYAMRHNGANFLNPKSRDMSIMASSSADVELFLLSLSVVLLYLLYVGVKRISLNTRCIPAKKVKFN